VALLGLFDATCSHWAPPAVIRRSHSDSAPGKLCPFASLVAPLITRSYLIKKSVDFFIHGVNAALPETFYQLLNIFSQAIMFPCCWEWKLSIPFCVKENSVRTAYKTGPKTHSFLGPRASVVEYLMVGNLQNLGKKLSITLEDGTEMMGGTKSRIQELEELAAGSKATLKAKYCLFYWYEC